MSTAEPECPFAASKVAAAPHVVAFGLIQVYVFRTIVAQGKTLFNAFHRKVQPPGFPVDGDVCECTKRRGNAERTEHFVRKVFLHVARVRIAIIQSEFIKAIQRAAGGIMVELHLEAVPLRIARKHGRKAGVSLAADPRHRDRITIHGNITGDVLLRRGVCEHALPIAFLDGDINRKDTSRAEHLFFIRFRDGAAFAAEQLRKRHQAHGKRHGGHERHRNGRVERL